MQTVWLIKLKSEIQISGVTIPQAKREISFEKSDMTL